MDKACEFFSKYESKDLKSLEVGRLKLPTKSGGIGLWKDIYRYSLYISILSNTYLRISYYFLKKWPGSSLEG